MQQNRAVAEDAFNRGGGRASEASEVRQPQLVGAQNRSVIKTVAFDALAIFDSGTVFHLAEELFPGRGALLSSEWRTRQFEYAWLRNSMHEYTDFWNVT